MRKRQKEFVTQNKAIFHFLRFTRYMIVKPEATVITTTTTTRILVLCFLIICVCHLTACYECIFIFVVQWFFVRFIWFSASFLEAAVESTVTIISRIIMSASRYWVITVFCSVQNAASAFFLLLFFSVNDELNVGLGRDHSINDCWNVVRVKYLRNQFHFNFGK